MRGPRSPSRALVDEGEGADEGDADVRIEARAPHEDEVFAELVEAGAIEPVVKATVLITESGFAGI